MTSLRYPKERLTDESDYLKMSIAEYVPRTAESIKKEILLQVQQEVKEIGIKKSSDQIILPIPRNIQDTLPVDWTDGSLNPLEAFALKTGSKYYYSRQGRCRRCCN